MSSIPTETRYEKEIVRFLTSNDFDGFSYGTKIHTSKVDWYDRNQCLIGEEYIQFLSDSQPELLEEIQKKDGENWKEKLLKKLSDKIKTDGLITVLRKGFSTVNHKGIKTIYFPPTSNRNPKYVKDKFSKNRFLVVRQLHYSPHNENSIDMVVFINGIPIITIELKNQMTGQTVKDSNVQYKTTRNPNGEPLLQFQRCVCHFSVDNDRIFMTTHLKGQDTFFLPFNKTLHNRTTESKGYKVEYLWEDILTPNSLFDILENLVLPLKVKDTYWDDSVKGGKLKEKTSDVLIFPRYHQLDVLRKLRKSVLKDGVGTNYLIQHTTGSGKSFSIGWLSFLLFNLFDSTGEKKMFDTIVILTDRKVLDKQLQDTVKSLEKVTGVVKNINKNSSQLQKSLEDGNGIVVTTIQKFGVVVNRMRKLKGKKFGVIIDEVHSSQGGKNSKNVNKTLSMNEYEDSDIEITSDDIDNIIKQEMVSRQRQDNISFFGFTGTPKPSTLEVFGTPQSDGTRKPFHSYTMEQSIGEGFTLDVLKYYTTVDVYFKLRKKVDNDVELPESRGKKELIKWVNSNPEIIKEKVGLIIDRLVDTTVNSINKRGKGMVIVRSIDDSIQYFHEMTRQLKERGLYESKIRCIVGFSGEREWEGEKVNEHLLNETVGFDTTDIPEGFKNPLYRVLIVCDKFQTGFDQPLLHSMFVDKPLDGVQCVQTLSRLNRTTKDKKDTFILDFVNTTEKIRESFQRFYKTTILSEETDPELVMELLDKIKYKEIFYQEEVEQWNQIFFNPKRENDGELQPILNTIVDRWLHLETDEERNEIRVQIKNYYKLYGFLSMIYQFGNDDLFKHYVMFPYLIKKFPVDEIERIDITGLVDLESHSLDIKNKVSLSLQPEDSYLDPSTYGSGGTMNEEEEDLLSELIKKINEVHGINIPEGQEEEVVSLVTQLSKSERVSDIVKSDNSRSNKEDELVKEYDNLNKDNIDRHLNIYELLDSEKIKFELIKFLLDPRTSGGRTYKGI